MRLYFSRAEQLVVAILLIAIFGALCALSYTMGRRQRQALPHPVLDTAAMEAAPVTATPTSATAQGNAVVHVAGAVRHPGVYALSADSRVHQAIAKAGGVRADAYPDALNLAERLVDAEKIYVPTKTEWQRAAVAQLPPTVITRPATALSRPATRVATITRSLRPASPTAIPGSAPASLHPAPTPPSFPINLNTATAADLEAIPSVGPTTAQRIIEYRTAHGPFTDPAQLLNVPRIGDKTLEKLTPYLTVK